MLELCCRSFGVAPCGACLGLIAATMNELQELHLCARWFAKDDLETIMNGPWLPKLKLLVLECDRGKAPPSDRAFAKAAGQIRHPAVKVEVIEVGADYQQVPPPL